MKSLRLLSAIFLVAAASICAAAQDRPWEYWRNSEGYLQNQYEVMLALASIDAVLPDTRCDTWILGCKSHRSFALGGNFQIIVGIGGG